MTALFRQGRPVLLEGVEVDAKFSELHTYSGQVSRYAREDGALAADHIMLDPATVDIVCSVGNAGLRGEGGDLDRSGRAKTAIDALLQLRKSRELYDLVTEHQLYTNMAFLGLSWGNEAPFAGRAELRAHFEESPSSAVGVFAVPPSGLSTTGGGQTNKTASAEVDAGRQDAETEESAPRRSFAAQILGLSEDRYSASDTP